LARLLRLLRLIAVLRDREPHGGSKYQRWRRCQGLNRRLRGVKRAEKLSTLAWAGA
jgi:hypothetical protein